MPISTSRDVRVGRCLAVKLGSWTLPDTTFLAFNGRTAGSTSAGPDRMIFDGRLSYPEEPIFRNVLDEGSVLKLDARLFTGSSHCWLGDESLPSFLC